MNLITTIGRDLTPQKISTLCHEVKWVCRLPHGRQWCDGQIIPLAIRRPSFVRLAANIYPWASYFTSVGLQVPPHQQNEFFELDGSFPTVFFGST